MPNDKGLTPSSVDEEEPDAEGRVLWMDISTEGTECSRISSRASLKAGVQSLALSFSECESWTGLSI